MKINHYKSHKLRLISKKELVNTIERLSKKLSPNQSSKYLPKHLLIYNKRLILKNLPPLPRTTQSFLRRLLVAAPDL
jgi:hypothetical protein